MTLTELCDLYESVIGEIGAECPRCHGTMTEDMQRGTWICWVCGQQFREGDRGEPVPVKGQVA